MSDNCCGTHVPEVPERPFDIEQPAYVLVDGKWIDMGEVIERYLPDVPPPVEGGVVLQMKRVIYPIASLPLLDGQLQLTPLLEIVPRSPNSRLHMYGTANTRLREKVATGTPKTVTVSTGFRYQNSVGVWDSDFIISGSTSAQRKYFVDETNSTAAFQFDLGPADRRTDDGKWALAIWAVVSTGFSGEVQSPVQITIVEYLDV